MANISGTSGSLSQLLTMLRDRGIHDLDSLADIDSFLRSVSGQKTEVERHVRAEIQREKIHLETGIAQALAEYNRLVLQKRIALQDERQRLEALLKQYRDSPPTGVFSAIVGFFQNSARSSRHSLLLHRLETEAKRPFVQLEKQISDLERNLYALKTQEEELVVSQVALKTQKGEKAAAVISENRSLYLGAVGEEKAVGELSKLPAAFYIVNDFNCTFDPPIYKRETDDHIMSVQCDHLVIGPTGLFIIETKNWSRETISDKSLRSPVDQIVRFNYALFVSLNRALRNGDVSGFPNHAWGTRKLSPQNIILLINNKPNIAFQWVHLLSLGEIVRFITRGRDIFSPREASSLAEYLANISGDSI